MIVGMRKEVAMEPGDAASFLARLLPSADWLSLPVRSAGIGLNGRALVGETASFGTRFCPRRRVAASQDSENFIASSTVIVRAPHRVCHRRMRPVRQGSVVPPFSHHEQGWRLTGSTRTRTSTSTGRGSAGSVGNTGRITGSKEVSEVHWDLD